MGRTRTSGEDSTQRIVAGTQTQYNRNEIVYQRNTEIIIPTNYKVCKDEIHPNHPFEGGPLSIISRSAHFSAPRVKTGYLTTTGSGIVYDSCRYCIPYSDVPATPSDGLEDTEAYGPEAWDKFRPKYQKVNLGQFFAELRDFPKLFKFKLKKFRDLGSSYLNYQFGWRPFVSDVRSFLTSLSQLDAQIARLRKQNGKWIKRGGTLVDNCTTYTNDRCNIHISNYVTTNSKKCIYTQSEKVWFSAAFRFYIPDLENDRWGTFRAARKIWGLELTPALVWELIPYSWLIDWSTNIGNCINNLTAITNDNLVARNAYVMRHTISRIESYVTATGRYNDRGRMEYNPFASSSVHSAETKARAVASPYGFNMSWPDFSPYQLAILTALGISHF